MAPSTPLHLALLKLSEKIGRALRETEGEQLPYPHAIELLESLEDDIKDLSATLTDAEGHRCQYCDIEDDDPRAKQPCASSSNDSPYHHFPAKARHDDIDEAYERAASRARSNDFEDTGGKDWT